MVAQRLLLSADGLGHTSNKICGGKVRHANWSLIDGRRGQIEDGVRAIDVSDANDWSEVRVWFAPIQGLGTTHWPLNGFIYPGASGKDGGGDRLEESLRSLELLVSIDLYRNGKPYGKGYSIGDAPITFAAKDSRILFGLRHTGGSNGFIKAEIDEARLYERALTATELRSSFEAGPNAIGVSFEELTKAMSEAELKVHAELKSKLKSLGSELAALPKPERVFTVAPKAVPITHILARGNVEKPKKDSAGWHGVLRAGSAGSRRSGTNHRDPSSASS